MEVRVDGAAACGTRVGRSVSRTGSSNVVASATLPRTRRFQALGKRAESL